MSQQFNLTSTFFILCIFSFLFFCRSVFGDIHSINCNGTECDGTTFNTTYGSSSSILCNNPNTCSNSSYYCSSNAMCSLNCTGANSCSNFLYTCTSAQCSLLCSGPNSCSNLLIFCLASEVPCSISCSNSSSPSTSSSCSTICCSGDSCPQNINRCPSSTASATKSISVTRSISKSPTTRSASRTISVSISTSPSISLSSSSSSSASMEMSPSVNSTPTASRSISRSRSKSKSFSRSPAASIIPSPVAISTTNSPTPSYRNSNSTKIPPIYFSCNNLSREFLSLEWECVNSTMMINGSLTYGSGNTLYFPQPVVVNGNVNINNSVLIFELGNFYNNSGKLISNQNLSCWQCGITLNVTSSDLNKNSSFGLMGAQNLNVNFLGVEIVGEKQKSGDCVGQEIQEGGNSLGVLVNVGREECGASGAGGSDHKGLIIGLVVGIGMLLIVIVLIVIVAIVVARKRDDIKRKLLHKVTESAGGLAAL
eukprot:TRINITY_DN2753_c0_g1_i1.p1 TRINITY_DN2753_c0_g1~~TRINITY_DN2753_c0_g1_i1.p1  ORF type:complete len:481 (-),score=69.04 TRINITY_DN2753_c0_g1_i1:43-1485(-)